MTTAIFTIDDGAFTDMRSARLLERHGFRGTFYIPPMVCELEPADIVSLSGKHEIGSHTMTHPQDLKLLTDETLAFELKHSKEFLENLLGKPVTKFCYPRGRFDERVKQAVKDAGYTSARTTRLGVIAPGSDPFEQATTFHVFNKQPFYGGIDPLTYLQARLDESRDWPERIVHVWWHSHELDKHSLWGMLDETLAMVRAEVEA